MKFIDEIITSVKGKNEHIQKDWMLKQLDVIKNKTLNEFKDQIHYFNSTKVFKPSNIEKYDVVYTAAFGIPHPILIFKVKDGNCYGILMSSSKGSHCLYEIQHSRFFKGCCATITLIKEDEVSLLNKWVGVFDNKREADIIISTFKKYLTSIV